MHNKLSEIMNKKIKIDKCELIDLNITVISDIVLEPFLLLYLFKKFVQAGRRVKLNYILVDELIDKKKMIRESELCIVWMNYENLFSKRNQSSRNVLISDVLDQMELINKSLSEFSDTQIIWMSFEDYYDKINLCIGNILTDYTVVDEINNQLKAIVIPKSILIDLKRLIALVGIGNAYNLTLKYRWNSIYSEHLIEIVVNEIYKQYCVIRGLTKKCIVLDCDNVLWGGILSEDGVENIKISNSGIGRIYQDFQRYLLRLHNLGVILAVCSKNDIEDVKYVFDNHDEMVLREKHIAYFKVNWENKAHNIKAVAEYLNIGLDSMVFIDDSIFEIESLKYIIPEVETILFKKDTIFDQISQFNLTTNVSVEGIEKRMLTYKSNELRENLKLEYNSYKDYLNALRIKVNIKRADSTQYTRIAELSQRTNKCTIGRRYSVSELREVLQNKEYDLYSVYVSDKFSDLGLVGAFGVIKKNEQYFIDMFCLSCRSVGREVEEEMLRYIIKKYKPREYFFVKNQKNESLEELFKNIINEKNICDSYVIDI